MKFEKQSLDQWKTWVNAQLKNQSIDDYATLIEQDIQIPPYHASQEISTAPLFSSDTQFISNVIYQDAFSKSYIGNLEQYLSTPTRKGFIKVKSIRECIEIEENETNEFLYLVDAFYEFETHIDQFINLEEEYNMYDTLSEVVQTKIHGLINIALHQNAGAAVTTQLAIAMAKLNEWVTYFSPTSLSKVYFKVAVGDTYLVEIAKLRALRMLFQNFVKALELPPIDIQIIAECSTLNKTPTESENNLIRSTLETSAAILGGVSHFYAKPFINSKDNAKWANELSVKQGLIASHEALLNYYSDALAGSYLVEKLSKALAEKSWQEFQTIEKEGGYLKDFNTLNTQIQQDLKHHIEKLNAKKQVLVGYNKYDTGHFKEIPLPKKSPILQPFRLP